MLAYKVDIPEEEGILDKSRVTHLCTLLETENDETIPARQCCH